MTPSLCGFEGVVPCLATRCTSSAWTKGGTTSGGVAELVGRQPEDRPRLGRPEGGAAQQVALEHAEVRGLRRQPHALLVLAQGSNT
jgi:hypothetical protein